MSCTTTQEQQKTVKQFIEAVKFANEELAFKYLSICDFNDVSLAISLYLDSPDYNKYRKEHTIIPKNTEIDVKKLEKLEEIKEEKPKKKVKSFQQEIFELVSYIKLTIKTETLKILQSILKNILTHFEEEKFRKVPLKNQKIIDNIVSVTQAVQILVLFKFTKNETHLILEKDACSLEELKKNQQLLEKAIESEEISDLNSPMSSQTFQTPNLLSEQSLKDIILDCQKNDKLFVDPHFPPNETSLFKDKFNPTPLKDQFGVEIPVVWKRPWEYCPQEPFFFSGKCTPGDIKQGSLGDCWFVCAASIVAKRTDLLENLFVSTEFGEFGVYACRFYKNGWKTVIVDDYIPCNAYTGYPIYSQNLNHSEIWVSILEKAYAKLHGSYENIDTGFINDGMLDLTGGTCDTLILMSRKDEKQKNYVWSKMQESFDTGLALMGVLNVPDDPEKKTSDHGIVGNHAYSVLDMKVVGTEQLIYLRNPWGDSKYTGKWSFKNDEIWTEEMKEKLEYHDPYHDEGCFWINYDDFFKEFNRFYLSHLIPDDYKKQIFKGKFDESNSGGAAIDPNFIDNPQYQILVSKKTHLIISLHQPDARLSKVIKKDYKYKQFVTYLTSGGIKGERKIDNGIFNFITPKSGNYLYKPFRDSDIEFELEPSEKPYVLIVSPDFPGILGTYTLRISSNETVEVTEMPTETKFISKFEGRWAYPLNGGCQNYSSWKSNPTYQMDVKESTKITFVLTQPEKNKWNGIGINVYSKEIRGRSIKYSCAKYIRGAFWTVELDLKPEESPYFILPCTFEPDMNLPFSMKLYTKQKDSFKMKFLSENVQIDKPIENFKPSMNQTQNNAKVVTTPLVANPQLLKALMNMGFDKNISEKALLKTGNNDPSKALDWILKNPF
eukprot:gene1745-514_t